VIKDLAYQPVWVLKRNRVGAVRAPNEHPAQSGAVLAEHLGKCPGVNTGEGGHAAPGAPLAQ